MYVNLAANQTDRFPHTFLARGEMMVVKTAPRRKAKVLRGTLLAGWR